ncbi:MAG: uroporphyrinogen decarboxylase family protein [Candidatus Bathyarchaeia archaeon]
MAKSSLERCLEAFDGESDRIPFAPFIMHFAAELLSIDYSSQYCQNYNYVVEGQIKCWKNFDLDVVCVSTDAYREAEGWGVKVSYDMHTPYPVRQLDIGSFDSVEAPEVMSGRMLDRIRAVEKLSRSHGSEVLVIGWIEAPFAELCCLFGVYQTLLLARRNPALLRRILDRVVKVQEEFAKAQIEAGAHVIGAGDSIISQIGPGEYKRTALDTTRKLFHALKVPVLYHCCGDNSIVNKDGDMLKLIASSGAKIIDIDTQVNLKVAKEKIGECCIRGNVNTTILGDPMATTEAIFDACKESVETGKINGRYMFAAGCEWPWRPLNIVSRNLGIAKAIVLAYGTYA